MRYPGFVGSAYRSESPVSSNQQLINMYVDRMEATGATSPQSLYPTPGFEPFLTVTESIGWRAMFSSGTSTAHALTSSGQAFGVCGNKLIEIFADKSYTVRGIVATNANPATISSNGDGGDQLFVTSGGKGYCYDLTANTLTEISGLVADQGGFLSGYFVAFNRAASEFRRSDLFDGSSWDPAFFFARTTQPDPWQAMFVTPFGQICLPGSKTGEFWYPTGDSQIFAPDPSGYFAYGIAATFSITQSNNQTVWLSQGIDGGFTVLAASGFRPQRISTEAVELAVASYARQDDAIGQTYSNQGHTFYLLTFPTAHVTWCYDFSTNQWHKRGVWITEDSEYDHMRAVFHGFAFGKHLMGDTESNVLYEMANDLPLDVDGRVIRRIRRAPAITDQMNRVYFDKLQVLVQPGLGRLEGPCAGRNPQMMLRYSDDFGMTWSNERICGVGRIGQYARECFWWSLGSGKGRVFEVSMSDPIVNWRITDAYLWARRETRLQAS